jgi:hypothetical protein
MFLYEALLSIVILTIIITEMIQLLFTYQMIREKAILSKRMQDVLIANLILYENNQPFTVSDTYIIEERDGSICIVYHDLNDEIKESCLEYEK